MKRTCLIILQGIIFFNLLFAFSLFPEEKDEEASLWTFTLGGKGVNSSGESDSYTYYVPYAKAGIKTVYLKLLPGYSYFINYQITDGYGNYKYINISQASLEAGLTPWKFINLNFEYRYSAGESQYLKRDYYTELYIEYKKFALMGDYNYGKTVYVFNSEKIKSTKQEYSVEIDFFPTEALSFDLSYTYSEVYFENLDYKYRKKVLRLGTMPEIYDLKFIMAGISTGQDSDDYGIYGFDLGLNFYFYKYIRLSAMYIYTYYMAPANPEYSGQYGSGNKSGSQWGKENGAGGPPADVSIITTERNPYLSVDKVGQSYSTKSFSLGLSITY